MQTTAVSKKARTILNVLDNLGLKVTVHHHEPVFTVDEARSLRGEIPGGHSKNLFLKDRKNNIFLVSAIEDTTIDLKSIHHQIGAKGRVSFGSPELLDKILGVQPGAVSPLGLVNDTDRQCTAVLDKAFFDHAQMNFHPLDNSMTVSIAPGDLLQFLKHTGHEPVILDF
jgi:Ala-tRNA(Pro) deacylase